MYVNTKIKIKNVSFLSKCILSVLNGKWKKSLKILCIKFG